MDRNVRLIFDLDLPRAWFGTNRVFVTARKHNTRKQKQDDYGRTLFHIKHFMINKIQVLRENRTNSTAERLMLLCRLS